MLSEFRSAQLEGDEDEEAQSRSIIRNNPKSPTNKNTNLVVLSFPAADLPISRRIHHSFAAHSPSDLN